MGRLKILHVIPNLHKGGAQRLVVDICNELQTRNNVTVKLLVFEGQNDFKYISENIDIEICPSRVLPSILKKDRVDILGYEKIVSDFKPDIIHSHLYLAEMVSRENGRPEIVYFTHCHDNMPQLASFKAKTLLSKKKMTAFYERYRLLPKYKNVKNNFIVISKDTNSFFKNALPKVLQKNIHLMLNAINVKLFLSKKYHEPKSSLNLITVGNLSDKKNQMFLLQVVKSIKEKGITVQLKIIGDGNNRDLLKNEIHHLRLEHEVQLLGGIDKVEEYLWESDVYVHSALYEPFGLVLIEAMAAGLPVVSLDGKGNQDIIVSGKNGFLVSERDSEIFAAKILCITNNKVRHREMSFFAKQFAQQFDIKLYTDKLLNLYQQEQKRNRYTT